MIRTVRLPGAWTTAADVDLSVLRAGAPHDAEVTGVEILVPGACKLWLCAVLRLLSHCNQLARAGKPTTLRFLGENSPAMGYVDRMGFFDYLAPAVETEPARPATSGAAIYRGFNNGLVEIAHVDRRQLDDGLPDRLTEALRAACAARADADDLAEAASTLFSELIGNIHEHSDTDGFVAFQAYKGGQRAKVVVCDNGTGLMETLRPALNARTVDYRHFSDVELLVEMFRGGLSRHPERRRGQGLRNCATKAIRFRAELEVRLREQNARLVSAADGYRPATAYCSVGLPPLRGTHIAFTFGLAT